MNDKKVFTIEVTKEQAWTLFDLVIDQQQRVMAFCRASNIPFASMSQILNQLNELADAINIDTNDK